MKSDQSQAAAHSHKRMLSEALHTVAAEHRRREGEAGLAGQASGAERDDRRRNLAAILGIHIPNITVSVHRRFGSDCCHLQDVFHGELVEERTGDAGKYAATT
jgi:hypothetical protein